MDGIEVNKNADAGADGERRRELKRCSGTS